MASTNNTAHKKAAKRSAAAAHAKAAEQDAARQAEQAELDKQAKQPAPIEKSAKWMGALCYLSILILIPAASRWRKDDFVRFHLNQGIILLALSTVSGILTMLPGCAEIGTSVTVLVEGLSLIGLVCALRSMKTALPFVAELARLFHPF